VVPGLEPFYLRSLGRKVPSVIGGSGEEGIEETVSRSLTRYYRGSLVPGGESGSRAQHAGEGIFLQSANRGSDRRARAH